MMQRDARRVLVGVLGRAAAVCSVCACVGAAAADGVQPTRQGVRAAPARRAAVIEERADAEHRAARARVDRAYRGVARGGDVRAAAEGEQEGEQKGERADDAMVDRARAARPTVQTLVTSTDGYRGDITLDAVALGAGFELRGFISAARARNVRLDGPPDAVRLVRGPAATATTPTMTVGAFDDAPGLLSREDLTRAAPSLAAAATSTNLNQCVDLDRACEFSMDFVMDEVVTDNNAGPDALPELMFFERSAGRAGDAITVQALNDSGEEVGRAVVLGCDTGEACTPAANAAVYDRRLTLSGFESVTFVAVDLSSLDVTRAKMIRVRTPRAGDETLDGQEWSGDAGTPDFKVVGVKTDVPLPAWMVGD